jgi:hypothetical protein
MQTTINGQPVEAKKHYALVTLGYDTMFVVPVSQLDIFAQLVSARVSEHYDGNYGRKPRLAEASKDSPQIQLLTGAQLIERLNYPAPANDDLPADQADAVPAE